MCDQRNRLWMIGADASTKPGLLSRPALSVSCSEAGAEAFSCIPDFYSINYFTLYTIFYLNKNNMLLYYNYEMKIILGKIW